MSNGTALQIRRGAGRAATGFLVHAVRRACLAARVAARVAPMRLTSLKGAATVIFGQPGDAPFLGALTLESLGLMLDLLRRKLRPLPTLLLSLGGAAAQA